MLVAKEVYWLISPSARVCVVVAGNAYSALFLPLDRVWTLLDLITRQLTSFLTIKLQLLAHRFRYGIDEDVIDFEPPDDVGWAHYRSRDIEWDVKRTGVLESWSSEGVHRGTLDATRAHVARDEDAPEFWDRESKAFVWLVQCLDEDREILPFVEALPAFARDTIYRPLGKCHSDTLSAILLDRSLAFYKRIDYIQFHYHDSARIRSAHLEFCLAIPHDTLTSMFSAEPDLLFPFLFQLSPRLSDPPDVKIRIHGLRAIFPICWAMSIPAITRPVIEYLYRELGRTLGRNLLDTMTPLHRDLFVRYISSRGLSLVEPNRDPPRWKFQLCYFALVRFYVDTLPEVTPENVESVRDIFIAVHSGFYSCHQFNLEMVDDPQESIGLFCAVTQFVIAALETCSELITWISPSVSELLSYLESSRDPCIPETIHEILQSPFWNKANHLEGHFRWMFQSLERFWDDQGPFNISHSVWQKNKLFDVPPFNFYFDPELAVATVTSLDMRGADDDLQRLFVKRTTDVDFPADREPDPTTGLDSYVIFAEAMMELFYTLTDLDSLHGALHFVERFLSPQNYPYHQLGIKCREYLRATIFEKGRQEAGVQVDIQPEMSPWREVGIQTC